MASFGVIAEGVTDYQVLKSLLIGFCSADGVEPVVNQVQPPAATASQDPPPGGWGLVLDCLRRGRYREALQQNDYIVIQIDADVCDDPAFGVARHGLDLDELIAAVTAKLVSCLDRDFYSNHADRFIFAIAVDEIECWLLPLLFDTNESAKAAKTTGCLEAASYKLRTQLKRPPLKQGDHKNLRAYEAESKPYRKRAKLLQHGGRNPSLASFLDQLARKTASPPASDLTGRPPISS